MCRQCKARQARACVRDFGIPPPRRRRRSGTRTAALFFQTSRAPHCAPHGIFRYSFLRDKNEGSQRRFPRQARKARAVRRRCPRLRESRDRRRNMCMKIKIDRILGHSRPPPSVTSFLCQYFITYIRQCQSQKAKNRAAAQMRGSPLYISSVMVYHRRMIRIGLITAEPRPA